MDNIIKFALLNILFHSETRQIMEAKWIVNGMI